MADLSNKDKPTLTALHQQERRIEAQLAQAAQSSTNTAVQLAQRLDAQEAAQTALSQQLTRIERTLDRLTAVEKRNLGLDQRMKNIGFRLTDDIGENRRERGALTSRVESLEGAYEWVKHRLNEEQSADAKRLDALHTAVTALQNAPPPDLSPVDKRLDALTTAVTALQSAPPPDLAPLKEQLDSLTTAVTALQNAPPPDDLAPLKSQLGDLATAVAELAGRLVALDHGMDNLHDTQLQHAARHEAMSDTQTALSERIQENQQATANHLAHIREEQSALEHRQAQHTGRLDLLAQAQITAEHDIERTHALAHRALMRPSTLAAPFTVPAHLQDTTIHINTHPSGRIFQPAQFVRIGPAVGQLRDPLTDDDNDIEQWTFKAFTKRGAGATFTEGTAVELIGGRADALSHFD